MGSRGYSSMVHNQNLDIHYTEASAGFKTNVTKASKKGGGLGGRKPLGDLSNSLKTSVNHTSKTGSSAYQTSLNATKKKSTSKASAKATAAGRKALSDISNSGKPLLNAVSKKNYNALSVVPEEIAEERFLHNHAECIKAQKRSFEKDEFLQIVGLTNDLSKPFGTPAARHVPHIVKVDSPPRHLELLDITEEEVVGRRSRICILHEEMGSPSPCGSPKSPEHLMPWNDDDCVNFKLIETPEFLKH